MSDSVRAMPFRPALPMNRAVFHRLGLSVGIAIALAGCMDKAEQRDMNERFARYAIEGSTRHCIDDVVYIATQVRGGYSLTPSLQRDGKPRSCGADLEKREALK